MARTKQTVRLSTGGKEPRPHTGGKAPRSHTSQKAPRSQSLNTVHVNKNNTKTKQSIFLFKT